MLKRSCRGLLAGLLLASAMLMGCGGGNTPLVDLGGAGGGAGESEGDAGLAPLPGEPSLLGGARMTPDLDAEMPLPHHSAQAGVDFASNRFIAIYENQPSASSLAPYLQGAVGTGPDVVRQVDNAPLVQHPYFRKVSANLATQYGLTLGSRVFYKDVNFAVYEVPTVKSVVDLDAMMLKVVKENRGLVREVCYDFYLYAVGMSGQGELDPSDVARVFEDGPAGFRGGVEHGISKAASAASAPNDPYYANKKGQDNGIWGLWRIGAVHDLAGDEPNAAWDYTTGSSNVIVCVADTGARVTHEDLTANIIDPPNDPPYNEEGILTDVINKDNIPNDGHGHGTFCCGEIGATPNNSKGLSGVCWDVTILPIKVLSNGGSGSDAQVAEGMLLADYLGAHIISMSLGGPFPDRTTQLAAQQCNADGILLVVAAGNENTDAPFYPGYYPECLCVGATTLVNASDNEDFSLVDGALPMDTRYDARAGFSNYGTWVDIAAPGRQTLSCYKNSDSSYVNYWQGTSMATPYVAGCAALLWSYVSESTNKNEKIRGLLQGSATEMTHHNNGANPTGFVDADDNGSVRFCNVLKALELYEDDDYPFDPYTIAWNDPEDEDTVTGAVELQVAVSGGDGTVRKVEFETYARQIGVATAVDNGYWRSDWDTTFEFNRDVDLMAIAYDDKGNITRSTITVTPSNTHEEPPWSEDFTGLSNNTIPSDWYEFDGNEERSSNTSWGADDSTYPTGSSSPSMHSSGTTTDYVGYSNDWLFAPIIDLADYAAASLVFEARYQRLSGDEIYLLVTADDRTYGYLEFNDDEALHDWDSVAFDLAPYAGKEIRVFWVMQANGSSHAVGLSIDDVEIDGLTGTAPTIEIDSPTNGATVSGLVQISITASNDTELVKAQAIPPVLGSITLSGLSWTDNGDGTKSSSFYWDSRHVYNGGALLSVYAYDDEDDDDEYDDFVAVDSISLSVNNSSKDPDWFEGFESITNLGGTSGTSFDGQWYIWSGGTSMWRISSADSHSGDKCAKMGPDGSGDYGNWENDRLCSPIHDLSDAEKPYLRLWTKLDVEAGGDDYAKILLVRYDGLDDIEMPLGEYRGDIGTGWTRLLFDLDALKADPLRFNFLFVSNGDDEAGTGWLIDDYEILDADPQISTISNNARGQGGDTRTINGLNFGSIRDDSTVTFEDDGARLEVSTYSSWSDTAIEVVVPADATSGDVIVTVLDVESAGKRFAVVLDEPVIDNLDQL